MADRPSQWSARDWITIGVILVSAAMSYGSLRAEISALSQDVRALQEQVIRDKAILDTHAALPFHVGTEQRIGGIESRLASIDARSVAADAKLDRVLEAINAHISQGRSSQR
jgi:hypothetical protein